LVCAGHFCAKNKAHREDRQKINRRGRKGQRNETAKGAFFILENILNLVV
jgi:hypothetical protein